MNSWHEINKLQHIKKINHFVGTLKFETNVESKNEKKNILIYQTTCWCVQKKWGTVKGSNNPSKVILSCHYYTTLMLKAPYRRVTPKQKNGNSTFITRINIHHTGSHTLQKIPTLMIHYYKIRISMWTISRHLYRKWLISAWSKNN